MRTPARSPFLLLLLAVALIGAIAAAIVVPMRRVAQPPDPATATRSSSGFAKDATEDLAEMPLANEIKNLPLRDAVVVAFPRDWVGPEPRPYGVFYDPRMFRGGIPITDLWQETVLDIQADPQREFLGWWLKFQEQKRDWSEFHQGSLVSALSEKSYKIAY